MLGRAQEMDEAILIAPQAVTNTQTASGRVDTVGAKYASIRIALASEANTNAIGPELSLLECDTTVVTNFATIVADKTAIDLTAAGQVTYHVDLRGRKRYLRLTVTTETTTNDNITVGAVTSLLKEESRKTVATSGTSVVCIV
ncbi:MAG: hypothetical protein KAV00_02125 [Phycisphaerae bacterium]|nr:hypothetical protein [Phycisphaerae bacterium]